jgi:mitochondrial fission protein ELM1
MLPSSTWAITEGYAGLQSQALGLAEAAGLRAELRTLVPRAPWCHLPAAWWPAPLRAVAPEALAPPLPELLIGCGGKAAAVVAALRRQVRGVIIQHPRMDPRRFDLIIAGRHDGITGSNVVVTRTAVHRVTPARLAEAATLWMPRFAALPRPLVAVLVGGANGRYRLDTAVGAVLARELAGMMRADGVGLMLTPSRRTDPAVTRLLAERLRPLGAFVWDGEGENPYFGMLALADAIVATIDSVSMLSEAAATRAPLLLAPLPGRSRRLSQFVRALINDGRARLYQGRLEHWPVVPIDDTPEAAAEMCRRFGY